MELARAFKTHKILTIIYVLFWHSFSPTSQVSFRKMNPYISRSLHILSLLSGMFFPDIYCLAPFSNNISTWLKFFIPYVLFMYCFCFFFFFVHNISPTHIILPSCLLFVSPRECWDLCLLCLLPYAQMIRIVQFHMSL